MIKKESRRKAETFLKNGPKYKRKVQTCKKAFSAAPTAVFEQLCPTREYDWIDGWECDLVYTSTGYAEPGCIFTTPDTSAFGKGLWLFTQYDPPKTIGLAIISDDIAEQTMIEVVDNHDGTSTGRWTMTFTALNQEGNEVIDSMPDHDAGLEKALDGLEQLLISEATTSVS